MVHVLQIEGVEEGVTPRIRTGQSLGLDLGVDRRLLEVGAHVEGDENQQEGEQEWDAPRPGVERGFAKVGTCRDDHDERQHDPEGRRGL